MRDDHALETGSYDRRGVLLGAAGAVAGGGAAAALLGADTALGTNGKPGHHHRGMKKLPPPNHIPGGLDLEGDLGFPYFIHWFGPGPTDITTPFAKIGLMGEHGEPSTVGDFKGFNAYTILVGSADTTDGTEDLEADIRVMQGHYVAPDGSMHWGTFAFI
ncbi:MAG: hypothetical protein ACR2OD_01275 [Gaiellaceae bacterium]